MYFTSIRDCIPIAMHFTVYKSWVTHDYLSVHLVLVYLSLYSKGILFCGQKNEWEKVSSQFTGSILEFFVFCLCCVKYWDEGAEIHEDG
jgi:hypothetical protein